MKAIIKKFLLCLIFLTVLISDRNLISSNTIKKEAVELSSISSGNSQTIAILDTGINDKLFSIIKSNVVKVGNVIDNSENITDEVGHGTALHHFWLDQNKWD